MERGNEDLPKGSDREGGKNNNSIDRDPTQNRGKMIMPRVIERRG